MPEDCTISGTVVCHLSPLLSGGRRKSAIAYEGIIEPIRGRLASHWQSFCRSLPSRQFGVPVPKDID